ncbi:MAG: hypothetical protein JKY52_01905 [Flavobacteriales bacterium]|nr:hypothetical protein [Flavobacteriales bacterium]
MEGPSHYKWLGFFFGPIPIIYAWRRFDGETFEPSPIRYVFLFVLVALVLSSCRKDPSIEPESLPAAPVTEPLIPVAEFTQLKVGNYWIYQRYWVDTNGVEKILGTDSVYIPGDSIIKGKLYYNVKRTSWISQNQYLRDSSNYLVNQYGRILFSSSDFSNILHTEGLVNKFTINYQMTDKGLPVSTPAGIFPAYNYQGTYLLEPGWDQWGTIRYTNRYYAAGIGVIEDSYITSGSPTVRKIRLVKYFLK